MSFRSTSRSCHDGLVNGLQRMIQRYERTYPIAIHLDLIYAPGLLPLNQELNILRIVRADSRQWSGL